MPLFPDRRFLHVALALLACAWPARAADEPRDPIEHLRKRLEEKLGAQIPPEGGSRELRVGPRAKDESAPPRRPPASPVPVANAPLHGTPARSSGTAAPPLASGPRPLDRPGAHAEPWSYEGTAGPQAWSALKPEFATCGSGLRQSPIDIRDGFALQLQPVNFDYRASAFSVIDNGHTVQANVAPGNWIGVMGRRYELQQFHFHRPSEERVDGRQYDMTVHLVHKDPDGRLAVVAVLLERGEAPQPVVQAVWNNLPLERHEEFKAPMAIDVAQLLPDDRRYFTYMGSLTTPPCTEGVLWIVMKKPVVVTPRQVDVFARLYPMNARPIQSAHGRVIKESD
jgi:carbonic anhydrase